VRDDRDSLIIVMTLIPLVAIVVAFMMWHNSSSLPFPSMPDISLPALPDIHIPVPGFVATWSDYLNSHGEVMFPALAAGLIVGIVGAGTLIDAGRPVRRALHSLNAPRASRNEEALDDEL
jgi:ABC-type nitrate/sulfonate/bicarbonate transport system permease component